jgi:hypothetical protein
MARTMKHLLVVAFVAYIIVMSSPGVNALKCDKCRSIEGTYYANYHSLHPISSSAV